MKGRRVYLSGPMTGLPEFNVPAFNEKARMLRSTGLEVVNPAELGEEPGMVWTDYLRKDIKLLADCTDIYMLPGWRLSKGARLEHHIAVELGMPVHGAVE